MEEIIWKPRPEDLVHSRVARLMKRLTLATPQALHAWSIADIRRFWRTVADEMDLQWTTPFQDILDDSRGFPFARWFTGGETNIVTNCIDRWAAQTPDAAALIWEAENTEVRRWTYRELSEEISRCAAGMQTLGIMQGDRVGLYMPMIPELVIAFFAIMKLGAIVCPVFSGFGVEAVASRLQDAEATLLFTADGSYRRGKEVRLLANVERVAEKVPSIRHVVVVPRLGTTLPSGVTLPVVMIPWLQFLSQEKITPTAPVPAEAASMIIYTSGTTGRPKGCVHTHIGCMLQMGKELGLAFDVHPGDRFYWVTDIGWMMGPWELIGVTLWGGTVLIHEGVPNFPRPDRLWEIVERHRLTHLGISPTLIRLLAKEQTQWVDKHDLSSLRMIGSTGEPWDPESYKWCFDHVGKKKVPIINISGGTEIVGCLLSPLPVTPLKPCSLWGPALGMDMDIWNEDGKSVRGEVGYLICKQPAPSMTKGFWKDEARYLETYFDKWPQVWNHGDWAFVDADGFWFLRGRADDTIKIAGKRIGPAEIESALMQHPSVSEAAAIGVPHPLKGEGVVCFVVLKEAKQATEAIRAGIQSTAATSLGKAMAPEKVHFVTMLPKTRSGKILRGLIRKQYLGEVIQDSSSVENLDALAAITHHL